ncbi:TPA: hypothetical protein HA344_00825 [Candidatus Bathyarchaeota archaeon]|nr:hypothetical protein [Candidatus Bathyarchaeota archaeon]
MDSLVEWEDGDACDAYVGGYVYGEDVSPAMGFVGEVCGCDVEQADE